MSYFLVYLHQEKDTVVHSFYLGRDQLERQGQAYSGRTHLFKEQIPTGNASLALNNVQPQHQGEYICYINNENGRTKHNVLLLVAAPYDDPKLSVLYTCDLVIVTLTSSQGFPQPTVTWKHPVGSNVTTTELDTKGCYRVESNLTFSLNTTQTVVVEMSLDVLSQHFIREITLQPQQGCCERIPIHMRAIPLALTLALFITVLLLILIRTS
ncbi:CD276 antigen-like [Hoplias malabaricus]|uniref:CD276 antigen-like n=1 Tax=Hoplias malabaricus TaxID=27720 RepID=UPI003462879A